MKTKLLMLVLFAVFSVTFAVFAQDPVPVPTPPPASTGNTLLLVIIPLLVPIIVAIGKALLPKVPSWALPILAPALGALIDWLGSLATGVPASPITAAALGSAGVGLREIYDQLKQRISNGPTTTPTSKLPSVLFVAIAFSAACSTGYAQDTNTITATPLLGRTVSKIGSDIAAFFKDNTNFFEQRTAIVGVNALFSNGKETGSTGGDGNTLGAAVSVRFPMDVNGQISLGFFLAYFNDDFYDGSFSTTLGTTWEIPIIHEPIFTFVEGGPAVNLAKPDELLAQAFAGVVWKKEIIKATPKSNAWILFVNGAYGRLTGWDGDIYLLGLEVGHKF